MLLISDGREYTSEQQFAPIWRHRARFRRDLGLDVRWIAADAAAIGRPGFLSTWDVVGLKLSFRRSEREAMAFAEKLAAACAAAGSLFLYFDGDDDSAVQWPGLPAICDLYVKKHLFRDPGDYGRNFVGKSNLTDFVARQTGRSFAEDGIPATRPLEGAAVDRLHLGWNIALDDKMVALPCLPPEAPRSLDLCGRVHVAPGSWLEGLRSPAIAALAALPAAWAVAVPENRVSPRDYYRELAASRLCVSPFGYGEICWRDIEAILSGCLLVKPGMGHISTQPDLFVAGETYIPVAWDYSDLEAACAPYLANEEARIAIVRKAQARLLESRSADWFVSQIDAMFTAAEAIRGER